ncbi:toll/interleukin-1 receptor domain-containing protein [Actinocrispum wychmicini]|uniref:TIR domain-containing protein n=1 Tax=Actinocrispum wychmicini TaxID=1213861 RepID=A0A4R2JZ66_9PSEU|nr:toll/interleukin-1 receptor domain-containing protein [Actinocrispum wychmicini]TCO59415.1 TIR domain-containing protein [Actinocrispum wychmicini]
MELTPLVFINYRTNDQPWAAVLLDHVLSSEFGADSVFRASRSIPPGTTFDRELLSAVRRSGVLLVLIGDRWLNARDRYGRRAIDSRTDWVRREIAEAFSLGTIVVPVLIGDIPRLLPHDLPAAIRQLATCQYVRLRPRDSQQDVDHLLRLLPTLLERHSDIHAARLS